MMHMQNAPSAPRTRHFLVWPPSTRKRDATGHHVHFDVSSDDRPTGGASPSYVSRAGGAAMEAQEVDAREAARGWEEWSGRWFAGLEGGGFGFCH